MAVTQTGAIYKALKFDGESSQAYGVYITGKAVYNSPQRDVEMIKIPGRNGTFALDNGRFENIEVSYPAGIFADNETDFAAAISDFRNFLASRSGYCRLEDDYNPNEYRMAVYKSGLDVDSKLLQAGEFDITFDCKPQRWLTEGETAVTVSSGDELTNPTLFESGPLLAVEGYGSIEFNGYRIRLEDDTFGTIVVRGSGVSSHSYHDVQTITLDTRNLNAGDPIYPEPEVMELITNLRRRPGVTQSISGVSASAGPNVLKASIAKSNTDTLALRLYPDFGAGFVYGTARTIDCIATYQYKLQGGTTATEQVKMSIDYGGADTYSITITRIGTLASGVSRVSNCHIVFPVTYADSSKSVLGTPTYIDCELGEAYRIDGGEYTLLNQYVDLGSDLPKLASGSNEITFSNTVTELKITPRWWKV